ncbi:MAG: hypothetical protein U1E36_01700 [Rickettsiales bacterium]
MLKRERKPKSGSKSKKSRFVLMLGDEGAILILIEGNAVTRRLFAVTPEKENIGAFLDLLKEFSKTPIYCLVDMIDQSYVRHTLPPVTAIGLKKIIQRRLERDFPRDDLKGYIPIGREKAGRKDWHVLLISLAYGEILKKWLDIILDQSNRLAGIFLLPVESELIVNRIDQAVYPENYKAKKSKLKKEKKDEIPASGIIEPSKWKMLVSHHKVGGVRQVVLKEGKLVFTRLAQAGSDGNAELVAGNIEQEMLNTVEYLKRLGYNEKSGLDVFVVVGQDIKENLSGQRLGARSVKSFTPFELAELLDLQQAALSGDRFGDVVIATMFGNSNKQLLKLTLPITEKLEKLFMGRMAIRVAGVLLSLTFIGLTINGLIGYFSQSEALSDYTRKANNKQMELEEFQTKLKTLPADVNEINDVVALYNILIADQQSPLELVEKLYPTIDDNFLLKTFDWKFNHALKSPESDAKSAFEIQLDFEVKYNGQEWKRFVDESDRKMDAVVALFPKYNIKRGFLPGQIGDADTMSLSISGESEDPSAAKSGDKYTLSLKLDGPLPDGVNPATVTP